MRPRAIFYPEDPRSNEAAQLIIGELFRDPHRKNAVELLGKMTCDDLNYCIEESTHLLAVGSLREHHLESRIAVIANIVVARQFRGKGIGSRLATHLEHEARSFGFEVVRLHAQDSSVGFYEHIGYTTINPLEPPELEKVL
ncbi:MAG TPA: GNAT family N-acetyltransferase [Candidatus Saccharimonadia bacterium]|nr:GNAT family N-acetyltransferase [Candidatus Saccharimonadia bacterium]